MPIFTVHVDHLYTVEADSAAEALSQFRTNPNVSQCDATDRYVTDEFGEFCSTEDA